MHNNGFFFIRGSLVIYHPLPHSTLYNPSNKVFVRTIPSMSCIMNLNHISSHYLGGWLKITEHLIQLRVKILKFNLYRLCDPILTPL